MKKKYFYLDANNTYGWAMTLSIPNDETMFDKNVHLKDVKIIHNVGILVFSLKLI